MLTVCSGVHWSDQQTATADVAQLYGNASPGKNVSNYNKSFHTLNTRYVMKVSCKYDDCLWVFDGVRSENVRPEHTILDYTLSPGHGHEDSENYRTVT